MTEQGYVSRINQIDAAQLDEEIYKVLKLQTHAITKFCPEEKVEAWQPEIDAFLKFVIWCFSLGSGKSTFGQRLLDLNYAKLNRQKAVLFLIFTVVPVYLRDKLVDRRRATTSASEERLRKWVEMIANIFHLLSFFNLLVFLHRGKQPSIVERLLGVSSENSHKHKPRQIGYSYMTRELLWHGLMELFSMGLPMINFHSVKQTILRFWTKNRRNARDSVENLHPHMDTHTLCTYCHENPILPR
ncbi:peroxisome biogenesis factor 2 isoform X2 [Venturia canescens]|nr:peroxisome biogenesis factor 2 isoform X2 [Venturia canescens]